jgi:putative ABC transport system ATP-binding protein
VCPAVLELREVSKSYPVGDDLVEVLHGASATIGPEKMVGIVGPSGSGKSTLLNLIGTLIGGIVSFEGPGMGFLESQGYVIDRAFR